MEKEHSERIKENILSESGGIWRNQSGGYRARIGGKEDCVVDRGSEIML